MFLGNGTTGTIRGQCGARVKLIMRAIFVLTYACYLQWFVEWHNGLLGKIAEMIEQLFSVALLMAALTLRIVY